MKYRALSALFFAAALILTAAAAPQASAAQREFSVRPSAALQQKGVTALSAATPEGMAPAIPQIAVQMRFTAPFAETIELRAYDANGALLARSNPMPVQAKAGEARPVTFVFPKDMPLAKVTSLEIMGPEGGKRVKKTESLGEEAKEIVKELIE